MLGFNQTKKYFGLKITDGLVLVATTSTSFPVIVKCFQGNDLGDVSLCISTAT